MIHNNALVPTCDWSKFANSLPYLLLCFFLSSCCLSYIQFLHLVLLDILAVSGGNTGTFTHHHNRNKILRDRDLRPAYSWGIAMQHHEWCSLAGSSGDHKKPGTTAPENNWADEGRQTSMHFFTVKNLVSNWHFFFAGSWDEILFSSAEVMFYLNFLDE